MSVGCEWMYTRLNADGTINKYFVDGVESFIAYACVEDQMTYTNLKRYYQRTIV